MHRFFAARYLIIYNSLFLVLDVFLALIALLFIDFSTFSTIVGSIYRIWWLLPIIAYLMCSFDLFFTVINMCKNVILCEQNYSNDYAMVEKTGYAGSGKTTAGVMEFYYCVKKMQNLLHLNHYLYNLWSKNLKNLSDDVFVENLREVNRAWDFYSNSPGVSCAYSNIPVTINGQYVHIFEYNHALGEFAVPPYTVELIDEASTLYPTTMHSARVAAFVLESRYKRHQHKTAIYIEQERDNINKDVRRVIAVNEEMQGRTVYLKPRFLIMLNDFLINLGMGLNIQNPKFGVFLNFLDRLISKIGIVLWDSTILIGPECKLSKTGEKRQMFAFLDSPVKFDSRCCRNISKTTKLNCSGNVWDKLIIDGNSEIADSMRNSILCNNGGENDVKNG